MEWFGMPFGGYLWNILVLLAELEGNRIPLGLETKLSPGFSHTTLLTNFCFTHNNMSFDGWDIAQSIMVLFVMVRVLSRVCSC
jgi:hypothetical protein